MTDVSYQYSTVQTKLCVLHMSLSWAHMAAECGVCASTIKAFAYDETKRPQYRTVALLADYVGFRMAIQKVNALKDERLHLYRIK